MNTVGKGFFWSVVAILGVVVVGISTLKPVSGPSDASTAATSSSAPQSGAAATEKTPDQVVDEMHNVFKGQPDS